MLLFYQGSNKDGMHRIDPVAGFDHDLSSHFVSGSPCPPSAFPPRVCDLKLFEISSISSDSSVLFPLVCLFLCFVQLFCFLFQGEVQPNEINHKSTNPFDYPFDSDVEHNNTVGHDS